MLTLHIKEKIHDVCCAYKSHDNKDSMNSSAELVFLSFSEYQKKVPQKILLVFILTNPALKLSMI